MLISLAFWSLPVLVVLLAGWAGTRFGGERARRVLALPQSRWAPLVAGLVTGLVIWYVWGCTLRQIPFIHDEASYVLQAETFAHFRWAMPSPPLPEFFEQFHVLVTPTFASKYPPGHGLLLVPGFWLGLPGLVPLLLNALAGALLFLLVRRAINAWVATLTLVLWLPLSGNLLFRPSYLSENTTSVLWLLGWWGLLRWREDGRERWLLLLAGCTGWMAITRPLTAVAFAIPAGIVVLWYTARTQRWRALVRPMLLGVAILSLLPVWSAKTTGNWRETPYALYTKLYLPFDVMGFGLDSTPPRRALPADMQVLTDVFSQMHAAHTLDHVPEDLFDRWRAMFVDAFRGARLSLALFAAAGLLVLPATAWFAVAGSLVLTGCYLVYAHDPSWVLYYLEIMPIFPLLTACGVWGVWLALGGERVHRRRMLLQRTTPQAAVAGLIFGTLLLLPARADVVRTRRLQTTRRAYQVSFATAASRLPDARTVVFIRYAPWHLVNRSLLANQADLPDARTWFVYDRDAENAKLLALAPGRAPYLYDERTRRLVRLARPSRPAASPAGDSVLAAAKPRS
ncbi:MAG TPA: hypothetical protein VJU87_03585 [Gemmatimonadaceae bacterium]|nr:hypothetical protein [Gemmatimonadaceae bacterium]